MELFTYQNMKIFTVQNASAQLYKIIYKFPLFNLHSDFTIHVIANIRTSKYVKLHALKT